MKDIGFDVDKPKSGTKSKIPRKRIEKIEQYVDEIDDNAKQFARELNELPTSEDNIDDIMLQDIINKNEIATDNSIKLIETSLTEIGVEASTQTEIGGLTLRELQGLDRELRTISGSLRSAITEAMAIQVDIDKEKRKLDEMANDETYSDEQREEVRARLQRFQNEQKAINDQIRILKGRYSNQIYQIRESIMKFLNKEAEALGERIRTLFKEQGVTIVSILTAVGMAIGVFIEALLGDPTVSITTSQSTTTSDKKGGAREWIKNKLKALSQLLGKLADKALAIENHRFDNFMDFKQSKGSDWVVISEFVGAHNRCWSLDIHIFHDENEKEIDHLNSHQTVKMDVIPNIKATFSSS